MKHLFAKYRHMLIAPLLSFLILFTSLNSIAQNLSEENKNQLQTIAHYAVSAQDNTENYLTQLGYEKPAYISQRDWNGFPPVRKLDIAYKAAHQSGNGDQFIEAFTKLVANDYNSIKSERPLSHHFMKPGIPKVTFTNLVSLNDFDKINVPPKLKQEIITVSKYVNEGALGSLQTVMSNYMDLEQSMIYEILSKSENSHVAFEQGLARSKVPPPHEAKLSTMASDLQANYKALESDKKLAEIAKRNLPKNVSFSGEQIRSIEMGDFLTNNPSKTKKIISTEQAKNVFKESYKKYSTYMVESYKNVKRSFKSMRNFIGGFGGVIFGESLLFSSSPKLEEIRWQAINDTTKNYFERIGYLECYFDDNSMKMFGPVLYEDVFAANSVVEDTGYRYENGIGMVSIVGSNNINFSDGHRRFGITLHPAISNLRLGWAFAVVDAFASAERSFESILLNDAEKILLDSFYAEGNTTWKITDKQLLLKQESKKIKIEDIAIKMWGFRRRDTIPLSSKNFNTLLPMLCNRVHEFKRVNDFAKVLSIFRWAKEVKSKITNIEGYSDFIKQPLNIVLTSEGAIGFNSLESDYKEIMKEKEYFTTVLEYNKTDTNKIYAKYIESVIRWNKEILQLRDRYWLLLKSKKLNMADSLDRYFKKEDTSGLVTIEKLYSKYNTKWRLNNVKLNNPDSLDYYIKSINKAEKWLSPFKALEIKWELATKKIYTVYVKYKIKTDEELRDKTSNMSEKDKQTLIDNFRKIRLFRIEEDKLYGDVKKVSQYYSALSLLEDVKVFEHRNRIVSLASLYSLLIAEQKIMSDYFSFY